MELRIPSGKTRGVLLGPGREGSGISAGYSLDSVFHKLHAAVANGFKGFGYGCCYWCRSAHADEALDGSFRGYIDGLDGPIGGFGEDRYLFRDGATVSSSPPVTSKTSCARSGLVSAWTATAAMSSAAIGATLPVPMAL